MYFLSLILVIISPIYYQTKSTFLLSRRLLKKIIFRCSTRLVLIITSFMGLSLTEVDKRLVYKPKLSQVMGRALGCLGSISLSSEVLVVIRAHRLAPNCFTLLRLDCSKTKSREMKANRPKPYLTEALDVGLGLTPALSTGHKQMILGIECGKWESWLDLPANRESLALWIRSNSTLCYYRLLESHSLLTIYTAPLICYGNGLCWRNIISS